MITDREKNKRKRLMKGIHLDKEAGAHTIERDDWYYFLPRIYDHLLLPTAPKTLRITQTSKNGYWSFKLRKWWASSRNCHCKGSFNKKLNLISRIFLRNLYEQSWWTFSRSYMYDRFVVCRNTSFVKHTASLTSPTSLNFPSVDLFITKYSAESCGVNKYLKSSIFEIKKCGVCVPKISIECCQLTQSKTFVAILIKQQILLTIAGDPASSLAWFVYGVYTVHVQHNRGKCGT